jgi:hypothetical protein
MEKLFTIIPFTVAIGILVMAFGARSSAMTSTQALLRTSRSARQLRQLTRIRAHQVRRLRIDRNRQEMTVSRAISFGCPTSSSDRILLKWNLTTIEFNRDFSFTKYRLAPLRRGVFFGDILLFRKSRMSPSQIV